MKSIKQITILTLLLTSVAFAKETKPKATANPELVKMFGEKLHNYKKKSFSTAVLSDKKIIGIYFSAHWCPPCRAFTPELVKFHKNMTKAGNAFEVVFVSSDHEKSAMYEYMRESNMPWLVLPFGDEHKNTLGAKFIIRGIPSLIIIDAKGNLITKDGRRDVTNLGDKAFDKWLKQLKK